METENPRAPQTKTLWTYLREGLRKAHAQRPTSFYLLLAMPIVLLLGSAVLNASDTPRHFVFYVSVFFVFFFAVILGGIMDFISIAKRHFTEHEKVFRNTLGDTDFISRLGEQVRQQRDK